MGIIIGMVVAFLILIYANFALDVVLSLRYGHIELKDLTLFGKIFFLPSVILYCIVEKGPTLLDRLVYKEKK